MLEDQDFQNYAAYHDISDFADLSFTELIILEFLARYQKPVVRHTLFSEVKEFIEFKEQTVIKLENKNSNDQNKKFYDNIEQKRIFSTSSFYNSLLNLESKGLLIFHQNEKSNEKGKKTYIEATPFTKFVPKLLLKFLINNNIMDTPEYRIEFSTKFLELIQDQKKNPPFERVLSVWFTEYVAISIVQQFTEFADRLFILSKNVASENKDAVKLKKVEYSKFEDHKIREAEDFFDGAVVPVYKRNPKFFGMDRIEILKEIVRVLKLDGLLIVIAIAETKSLDNAFVDELIKIYRLALANRIFVEKELIDDLKKAGLKDVKVMEYKGLLIAKGNK